jgi:hypothetical protein
LTQDERTLIEKLRALPPDRTAEVDDFVGFLRTRSYTQQLTRDTAKAAEPAFRNVWDNPEDVAYDRP